MGVQITIPWWEREKLYTKKDKEAIERAQRSDWTDIDLGWAETEYGRYELERIISDKYHREEFKAGIL